MGYAEEAGIPLRMGLIRNHYVGRTFIQPQSAIRHFGVKVKLNPVRSILDGKRVVLVDDSIVRGTTSRKIVRMVRAAGAKEVHVRISCPPTISPCFYGVDTPRRSELIAATHTLDEIRDFLEADSVGYLSLEGLMSAVGAEQQRATAARATPANIRSRFRATRGRYLQLALKLDKRTGRELTMAGTSVRSLAASCVSFCAAGCAGVDARRSRPRPSRCRRAQLQAAIDKLGDLDYATRTAASRTDPPHAGGAGGAGAAAGRRRARRTATSGIGRSCCSPASTIRARVTRCASR